MVASGATFYPILQDKAQEQGDAWLRMPALGAGRTWSLAPTAASDAGPAQPCHMPVPLPVAAACPQGHAETPVPIANWRGGESIPAPTDAETRRGNPCSRSMSIALPRPWAAVLSDSSSLFAYSYL